MAKSSLAQLCLLWLGLAIPLTISGCSTGGGPDVPSVGPSVGCTGGTRFAYIIYRDSDLVSAHVVDDSGQFCSTGFGAAGTRPSAIATATLDPDRQYVYVTNSADNTVSVFKIGSNGTLLRTDFLQATGKNPQSIVVHPNGRVVYIANRDENTLSQYAIQAGGGSSDGSLQPLSPATVTTGAAPGWLGVDPGGHFVFVANQGDNSISVYAISADGRLTPASTTGSLVSPDTHRLRSGSVDPSGRHLYVTAERSDKFTDRHNPPNMVYQFAIASDGTFTPLSPAEVSLPPPSDVIVPIGTTEHPVSIAVGPAGKLVYVANDFTLGTDDLQRGVGSTLAIQQGALSPLSGDFLDHGWIYSPPTYLTVDPTGRFLYVLSGCSDASNAAAPCGYDGFVQPMDINPDDSLGAYPDGTHLPFASPLAMAMTSGHPTIPSPQITAVSPNNAAAGGAAFTLTVDGSGFLDVSVVKWNGSALATAFVSDTQLTAQVPAADIAADAIAMISVVNSTTPSLTSNAVPFYISVPQITSIFPASAGTGGPAFTLTVDGSGFTSASVVRWNSNALATAFASDTQLTAQVPASDIAAVGAAGISVVNDTSPPRTSNTVSFSIVPPAPPAGFVSLISENDSGVPADFLPADLIALSATGRYAAFQNGGDATNLVGPPTPSDAYDIYFHDSCNGVGVGCTISTRLASVKYGSSDTGGNDGNGSSVGNGANAGEVSISADGRFVAFVSFATDLVSPPAPMRSAFIRDTCTGTAAADACIPSMKIASLADDGTPMVAYAAQISASGRYFAFASDQAYVRDTAAGCAPGHCTILASADKNGNPAIGGTLRVAVSANGRFVLFDSLSPNLPGNNLASQVYLRDTCLGIPPSLACQPATVLISADFAHGTGNGAPSGALPASISDDGRYVAFVNSDALAPGATAGFSNLYLLDTCTAESGPVAGCHRSLQTVNVAFDGSPPNVNTTFFNQGLGAHIVSGTGRFVVFGSAATNLVLGGTPGGGVFVRDTCSGASSGCKPTTVLVSVDSSRAFIGGANPVISSDGHYCAFTVTAGPGTTPGGEEQAVLAATGF